MRRIAVMTLALLTALSLAGCASSKILAETPQVCKDAFVVNWVYFEINGTMTVTPATEMGGTSCYEVSPDTELTVTWDTNKNFDAVNLYWGSEDNIIAVDDDGKTDGSYTFTITLPAGTEPSPMWVKDAAGFGTAGVRLAIVVSSPEE